MILKKTNPGRRGFTLIELLIVMSIMLIIMAFAVPQMLKVKKTADETSAVQTLRTIGSAEASYNSAYPGSGYACPLANLGGDPKAGAPSATASCMAKDSKIPARSFIGMTGGASSAGSGPGAIARVTGRSSPSQPGLASPAA